MNRREFLNALGLVGLAGHAWSPDAAAGQVPQVGERLPQESSRPAGRAHRVVWAIASPRVLINRDGRPPVADNARTYLEAGYPEQAAVGLQALGHKLVPPGNAGAVQGVLVDSESGAVAGGSDPRRDGHAIAW